MVLSANTDFEIRSGGSSTNGGGYRRDAGTTDYSQQTSAQVAVTDAVANGTTTITSATANFTSAMTGNVAYMSGGTGSLAATRVEVTYVNSTTITVDATIATGTGITLNLGGALASIGDLLVSGSGSMVAGNIAYVQYATYTVTSAMSCNISGTATKPIFIIGYDTDRSLYCSDANRPTITTSTNSTSLVSGSGSTNIYWRNFRFTSTAVTKTTCFADTTSASTHSILLSYFNGFTSLQPNTSNSNLQFTPNLFFCEITNCSTFAFAKGHASAVEAQYCWFHDTYGGVSHNQASSSITLRYCIFENLSNYGVSLTRTTTSQPALSLLHNIFYKCSRAINLGGNSGINPTTFEVRNNIFYGNGYDIYATNSITAELMSPAEYTTNAFGGATTSKFNNFFSGENELTLTADPFTDGDNGDFSMNNTAGGGAVVRAAGYPTVFPGGVTLNYKDLGAVQHQDSGGGGATEQSFSG